MSMEVKIKDGDMLIDATVEVANDVMLIIPKAPLSKKVEGKWTPKIGELFYYPEYADVVTLFQPESFKLTAQYDINKDREYLKGWVFKTWEECWAFCDKLNKALNTVTQ